MRAVLFASLLLLGCATAEHHVVTTEIACDRNPHVRRAVELYQELMFKEARPALVQALRAADGCPREIEDITAMIEELDRVLARQGELLAAE